MRLDSRCHEIPYHPGMSARRGAHDHVFQAIYQPSRKNMWLVGTTPVELSAYTAVLVQLWCCVKDIRPESDLVNGLGVLSLQTMRLRRSTRMPRRN